MRLWRKFINVLAPSYARPERRHDADACEACEHLERYHGSERCYYPTGTDRVDCGCQALRTQSAALSDEHGVHRVSEPWSEPWGARPFGFRVSKELWSTEPPKAAGLTIDSLTSWMQSTVNDKAITYTYTPTPNDGYRAGYEGRPLSDNPHDIGTDEHAEWTHQHIQGSKVRHAIAGTYGISDEERDRLRATAKKHDDPTAILDEPPLVFPGEEPVEIQRTTFVPVKPSRVTLGGVDLSRYFVSVDLKTIDLKGLTA